MQAGNDEIIVTIFIGTALTLFFAVIIVFLFILFNNKNKLNVREREMMRKVFDETLLRAQLEIKEQTMRHLAYELHDNLGQVASLIKIQLSTLQLENPSQVTKVEDTKELVRQLILDLKSLSLQLNSDRVVRLGLASALETEVQRLNKTGTFMVEFDRPQEVLTLNPDTTVILFRMMQEVINNAIKHSQAQQIFLSLQAKEKMIILSCSDNGVGFDLEDKLQNGGGAGLANLYSRAKLIHAELAVKSSVQRGTTVSITLPL